MTKTISDFHKEFESIYDLAAKAKDTLVKKLEDCVDQNKVYHPMPILGRVKEWNSVEEKLKRLDLKINSISEIRDLIGARIVLLFSRDVELLCKKISEEFFVVEEIDIQKRLREDRFGYSSIHYVIKIPPDWFLLKNNGEKIEFIAELQVRTLPQHLWAEISHKLQYKSEDTVPIPIRRSINRVSAILEIVDLECERVLKERDEYTSNLPINLGESLNTDTLAFVLDEILPIENKTDSEPYADLLMELKHFGINTPKALKEMLQSQLDKIIFQDLEIVKLKKDSNRFRDDAEEKRIKDIGVFFSYTGLVRQALDNLHGREWRSSVKLGK